ncbi:MAG: DUF4738 domain-containing protein [Bacteroidaceae bacterium]|nr:DUF4738 domain-containing protein [Bacteroidaceae bacterium]
MRLYNSMLLLSSLLVLSACTGCEEKKEDTKVVVTHVENTKKSTQSMQNYDLSDTLTIAGAKYTFDITRKPDTTLQKVKVESGDEYYDNNIHLVIKRKSDQSVFFEKTFNKHFFSSIVPSDFMRKSLLLGIVFDYDKADDHSRFSFAASVGDPEDDEMLVPIIMTISPSGDINIEKDIINNEVPKDGGVATIDPTEDQG